MTEPTVTPLPEGNRKVPVAPAGVQKKVRISHLAKMKEVGRPIVMVTAYDAPTAELCDAASADMLLVGDSVGTTVHGFETTLPVTMEMMILHTQAVRRGSKRSFIVTDLPFMSYQVSPEQALINAGRLVQEGGAEAVKLESSNERTIPMIRAIADSGIPVMGHIGLVPQSFHSTSGYRLAGRTMEDAERIAELAFQIQDAGAFALVVEFMPRDLATKISKDLTIPVIGIGAGAGCDGQVLVINDLIGFTQHPPSFAKKYLDLRAGVLRAVRKYSRDVREKLFPTDEHSR